MNKRLLFIIVGAVFLLVSTFIGILVHDNNLQKQEDLMWPFAMSSYRNRGYFKIDPSTILVSLERGDTNIFTPMLEDPQDVEELTDISINWTQEDFLKITSTLGQKVWNDPMDLKIWNVYSIDFVGNFGDPIGLYFAKIAYFKTDKNRYTTRVIEIEPYLGWVGWGGGRTYP